MGKKAQKKKYKVLQAFRDKHTKKDYEVNCEYEFTEKRVDAIVGKLGEGWIELVEDEVADPKPPVEPPVEG